MAHSPADQRPCLVDLDISTRELLDPRVISGVQQDPIRVSSDSGLPHVLNINPEFVRPGTVDAGGAEDRGARAGRITRYRLNLDRLNALRASGAMVLVLLLALQIAGTV